MRVTLLPSAFPSVLTPTHQYLTTYLINDTVAIDAGSLGIFGGHEEQARIRHVFLTHSHADHVVGLPMFLDTAYRQSPDCVIVHGSDAVLDSLRRDWFNGRVWPDYENLAPNQCPFVKLFRLEPQQTVEVEGLRLTPIEVDHTVPTFGFIVEDATGAVVFSSDTGPTTTLWERANDLPHLQAVFLELSFPDRLRAIADVSKHLTPCLFAAEMRKVRRAVRWIAVHIKPRYRHEILAELEARPIPGMEIVQAGETYQF
jgi:ribonuclease BN (tRNA processing enzyme)